MDDLFTPTYRGLLPAIGLTLVAWMPYAASAPGPIPNPFYGLRGNCMGQIGSSATEHECWVLVCEQDRPFSLPVGAFWALRFQDGTDATGEHRNGGVSDFNQDGFFDGADIDQFNNAFLAGDPSSDFNGDGWIDGMDSDLYFNVLVALEPAKEPPIGRPRK